MSELVRHFAEITAEDLPHVGGKGLSLGLLAQAGLPVPTGFVVTTKAYRTASEGTVSVALRAEILSAYHKLPHTVVAVRSSAIAEDGAESSFAGLQETVLDVRTPDGLIKAIEQCWESLHSTRATAYRSRTDSQEAPAMAVVVQVMVDATVAGVMFTRDPLDESGQLVRIEAAWGVGEAVVSGLVTPDRLQADRETGTIHTQEIAHKYTQIKNKRQIPVSTELQAIPCLNEDQVRQLVLLAKRVEDYYGSPRDTEWAFDTNQLWLLQARPITAVTAADRQQARSKQLEELQQLVPPAGTVWVKRTLIEVLSFPTPMTWSLVSGRLMAADGGVGAMYQDFGFPPNTALAGLSAYDLIGGQPYLNLTREPLLEGPTPTSGYPIRELLANPEQALQARRTTQGYLKWWRIPSALLGGIRQLSMFNRLAATFPKHYQHISGVFRQQVQLAATEDLAALPLPTLQKRLQFWVQATLVQFARDSLKPTVVADFLRECLKTMLEKAFPGQTETIIGRWVGTQTDTEQITLGQGLKLLAENRLTQAEFLAQFGHRGPKEMEISTPRWQEAPSTLNDFPVFRSVSSPESADEEADFLQIAQQAQWNSPLQKKAKLYRDQLRQMYLLREVAKNDLLLGYAEIRRMLEQIARTTGLFSDLYYYTIEEVITRDDLVGHHPAIKERKRLWKAAQTLEVPTVLGSNQLELIGQPMPMPANSKELVGFPLSAGTAEGPALVLEKPISVANVPDGYILVCPSTDPAWVPLFLAAAGLVMESGGALSHGAIVAREFGLPAAGGFPQLLRTIRTGQRLRVDGSRGRVILLD
ncbi:MAG: PEP/pyruvate-binding domain-containing protein [Zavarzinella sp.]